MGWTQIKVDSIRTDGTIEESCRSSGIELIGGNFLQKVPRVGAMREVLSLCFQFPELLKLSTLLSLK